MNEVEGMHVRLYHESGAYVSGVTIDAANAALVDTFCTQMA